MIKPILSYPSPILKQVSLEVTEITQEIKDLARDLIDTMVEERGLGISAVQIGVLKRVIVVLGVESQSDKPVPYVMINPVIRHTDGAIKGLEGCLSFKGIEERIERPNSVEVEYLGLDGNNHSLIAHGVEARCVMHEVDHLNGVLFIDKLSVTVRSMISKKLNKLRLG